jgi:uncharacterized protein (DUF2267 family)
MKHDEFIGRVQHYARLASRGDAERATRATLETLGERLAGGEPKDLASQLPPEIGAHLLHGFAGAGERFSLDEFYRRVSEREGEDLPKAAFHARAVIRVLNEAVSKGEINDILAQLPPEFDRFFQEAVEGPMPS